MRAIDVPARAAALCSADHIVFGSVCSGIEAASVAWHSLGWRAVWLAEIELFPSSVLAHHYPTVPNLGDMTKLARMVLAGEIEAPDVLVGGTPCQAYSVAGMRAGLDDERGQLTLRFMELADAIDFVRTRDGKPRVIIVWENVPGVLSDKTNAFGCFLAGLAGEDVELIPPGKKWSNAGCVYGPQRAIAWRTLDAQYFGLAQRRRRVFVVASARDGFDPAQVLFEWDGLRRDSAPSREARADVTVGTLGGTSPGGGWRVGADEAAAGQLIAGTLRSTDGGSDVEHARAHHLVASTGDISHCLNAGGMGRIDYETETFITQCVTGDVPPAIAFDCKASGQNGFGVGEISSTLRSMGHTTSHQNAGGHAAVQQGMAVRRLTPRECERLQGFPDDYTLVPHRGKPAADGPRYKALGNSMPVPVMNWIGRRITARLGVTA